MFSILQQCWDMMYRILLILCLFIPSIVDVHAQGDSLPPPHLGYGLHLDPNVPVDPVLVDRLGMDWVKLYQDTQIAQFTNKRILFRVDINPDTNPETLRAAMAQRATDLAARGVDAIEVHNEPNLSLEWNNRPPEPARYVELLRVSYQAIKSAVPNMIVVSGGLAPAPTTPDRMAMDDLEYARQMFASGAGQWFDAFGYHPYGFNAPPEEEPGPDRLNFRRTELIWNLMRQYNINKPIWLTEFGWLRDPAEDGVNCSESDPEFQGFAWLRVDGQTQADYIVRAFSYADRNWPWAGPMFLWNLNFSLRANDGSLAPCSHMRWFGLLRNNGEPTVAYNRVAAMPKRYSRYLPSMTLYANEMSLEVGQFCGGRYKVGEFTVANTGYPGSFSASVEPANAPLTPLVEAFPATVSSGQSVDVYVTTTGLDPGRYVLFINVRTTIGGQLYAQNVRGYLTVQDTLVTEGC
jgi:hypothetical protein